VPLESSLFPQLAAASGNETATWNQVRGPVLVSMFSFLFSTAPLERTMDVAVK